MNIRGLIWCIVLVATSLCASATGEDNLALAQKYFAQKNYAMAATHYAKVIEAGNNSAEIITSYADALYLSNNFAVALKQYELLRSMSPKTFAFSGRLCELYTKYNKYNELMEFTKDLLPKQVDDASKYNVFYGKAKALQSNYIYPKAIEAYQVCLPFASGKQKSEINRNIGFCYGEMGVWDKALPYFEQGFVEDSTNYKKLVELAIVFLNNNKIDAGIRCMKRAFEIGWPKTWENYYELASAYYDKKDYTACIAYLQEAQQKNPYNQDIASLIAFSYYNAGDTKKARKMLDDMLEINPNNAESLYLYGLTYQKEERTEKGEKYFERAFAIKPALRKLVTQKMTF
ncbi:MAG: hypothetical protein RL660_2589 [Bacteroidota bacterium]|jgi:tetratricopeptide (TPR) repeat protein